MRLQIGAYVVILVFAAVLSIGLLGGGLTGKAAVSTIPVTSGTVLSVVAALMAIGVLIVAGLQQK